MRLQKRKMVRLITLRSYIILKYSMIPAKMPCWEAFEPLIQGGRLIISLGFSAQAEHAHQNQGRLPFNLVLGQRTSSNHKHDGDHT